MMRVIPFDVLHLVICEPSIMVNQLDIRSPFPALATYYSPSETQMLEAQ